MRIIEITKTLSIPISNEEYDLLKEMESDMVEKRSLNARQQHIANQLVNKDILIRLNENGKIFYKKKSRP